MIVYADILLAVNIAVNYAILLTVDRLLKCETRLYRLLLGALTGSLFSLLLFADISAGILLFGIRLLSSAVITLITFGIHHGKEYAKKLILTASVSLIYCGFFILICQILKPPGMYIVNDVLYLDIDPLVMIGLTAVIYFILLMINKLFRERIKSTIVHLSFCIGQQNYRCIAKIDTACNLCEPFSGSPVILADKTVFMPDKSLSMRIIPYQTVNSTSFLYAVKADSVIIDQKKINKTVYIASIERLNNSFHAIINSEIIR